MKPTIVPEFDTNQTNITAPLSALLTDGYPDDDIPTAGNHNWLFYWLGQWCKWIDDGVWECVSLEVGGNLQVNGDAAVDGVLTANDDLVVAGEATFNDDVTVNGDVQADDFFYGTQILWLPPSIAQVGNTSTNTSWQLYDTGTSWTVQYGTNAAGSLFFPICLPEGCTITEWSIHIKAMSNTGTVMSAGLYKQSAWGTLALVGSVSSATETAAFDVTLSGSGLTEVMGQNKYCIKVNFSALSTTAAVFGGVVVYRRDP